MRNGQCISTECRHEPDSRADFCTDCGALFRTDLACINHENVKATRVFMVLKNRYIIGVRRDGMGRHIAKRIIQKKFTREISQCLFMQLDGLVPIS